MHAEGVVDIICDLLLGGERRLDHRCHAEELVCYAHIVLVINTVAGLLSSARASIWPSERNGSISAVTIVAGGRLCRSA